MKNKRKDQKQNKPGPIAQTNAASAIRPPVISKRGWKVIGTGIGVLVIGYFVLAQADPMGQNWASHVSPFVIVAGYALIGIGIVTKDPGLSSPQE